MTEAHPVLVHADYIPVNKNYETTTTKNCTSLLCKMFVLFLLPTNNTMMGCCVRICTACLVNHWCASFSDAC